MPKIINIHGPMAAGKSTIIEKLNKKLPTYSYVDRAYMKRMIKPAGRINARKISKKATFLIIKELMKLKKNILIQEVNPRDFKKRLKRYIKKYGYKIKSFYIYCTLKTALERDQLRSKKTRGALVRKIHAEFLGPEKGDVLINTEELSVDESVALTMKEIRKK